MKQNEKYLEISDRNAIEHIISLGAGIEEGGHAKLPLLEAAYFAEKNVLAMDKDELLSKARALDPLADDKYLILKFLRDRGYITRVSLDTDDYFRVHQKGIRPNEDRTEYVLFVVPPSWTGSLGDIRKSLAVAGRLRKELIIGYVEKNEPQFLKVSRKTFD